MMTTTTTETSSDAVCALIGCACEAGDTTATQTRRKVGEVNAVLRNVRRRPDVAAES